MPFQRTPLRALAVVGRAAIVVFAGDSAVATASSASPARSSGMLDGLVADVLATGVPGYNPSQAWAARALVSNASDLAHFLRSLLAGELLSPNLLREMTTTVEQIPGEPGGPRCGLGLERYDDADGTLWGHSDAI